MHFGAALRMLRLDAGVTLADLAGQLGVSSAYLSRVEHGHDPAPTPDRLVAIARILDVPPLVLLELAEQSGAAVAGYIDRVPVAGSLFLDIARRDLGPAEIARIMSFVDREFPRDRPTRRPAPRLPDLLDPGRVILDLVCTDIEDLIHLAVSRLPDGGAELAARVLARERESTSALGSGVIVPHAQVRGATTAAALVTLARPLRMPTPDGAPVAVAVLLISGERPRGHLELLARIARLARRGLAGEIRGLRSPERVLARVAALDA